MNRTRNNYCYTHNERKVITTSGKLNCPVCFEAEGTKRKLGYQTSIIFPVIIGWRTDKTIKPSEK